MKNTLTKLILLVLILTPIISGFYPSTVLAFPVEVVADPFEVATTAAVGAASGAITGAVAAGSASIVTATAAAAASVVANDNVLIGPPGTGGVPFNLANSVLKACVETVGGKIADLFTDGPGKFSDFASLGVSPREAIAIEAKIVKLKILKECYSEAIDVAKAVPSNLVTAVEKNTFVNDLTTKLNAVEQRIEFLGQRLKQSTKAVLEAVATQVLTQVGTQLTNQIVNKIIRDRVDPSVWSTVNTLKNYTYGIEYIRKNYPDKTEQAIVYDLMKNGSSYLPGRVQPLVRNIAETSINECEGRSRSFEQQMVCVGNFNNNPMLLQYAYENRAQDAGAQAQSAAYAQVVRDQGMLAKQDCSDDSFDKYKTNQESYTQLSEKARVAEEAAATLSASEDVDFSEFEKANKEYNDITAQMKELAKGPNQYLAAFCSGISNPGKFAADAVNNLINKNNQDAAQRGDKNLPYVAVFLKQLLVGQINSLLGNRASGRSLTNDALRASEVVTSTLLKQNTTLPSLNKQNTNSESGVNFYAHATDAQPSDPSIRTITLGWSANGVDNGQSITINAPPAVKLGDKNESYTTDDLSDEITVTVPSDLATAIFSLNVYDGAGGQGKVLTTAVVTATIPPAPTVAGVSTNKSPQLRNRLTTLPPLKLR